MYPLIPAAFGTPAMTNMGDALETTQQHLFSHSVVSTALVNVRAQLSQGPVTELREPLLS